MSSEILVTLRLAQKAAATGRLAFALDLLVLGDVAVKIERHGTTEGTLFSVALDCGASVYTETSSSSAQALKSVISSAINYELREARP